MMPGTGMGAAGTGMGQSPMIPGQQGGISPQLLQMLASMQGGGQQPGMPMVQPPPGPTAAGPQGTPMANYIGAGGNMAGMMQHPMGMPQNPAGMAGTPGIGATPGQAGNINPQIMALIQAMRGQQGGVPAMAPNAAAGSVPAMGMAGVPGGMPGPQQLGQLGATMQNPGY